MRLATDSMDVSDIDRILKIGAWLRSTGLDELPQFFNILKGEMSVVGPRPTLLSQVEQYDNNQFRRLSMKPGVTGWTAINEGHNSSWDERIAMDLWYVENFSIGLDILIILKTPLVMMLGRPAYFDQVRVEAAASSDIKDD
jgi:lipopolysaccharide/colanic/teichoic acid biosynthesis glycosyltransferase